MEKIDVIYAVTFTLVNIELQYLLLRLAPIFSMLEDNNAGYFKLISALQRVS